MATELAKAYVQIVPSAKGIGSAISKEVGGESASAGKSAGLNIAGAIKGAIAAAGIGTAIKAALEAGGNLQQSFGGLDTLYGDAAEGAKKYAAEAAKAGISANNYAEQAVSFGASLKAAYGGDTTKAMEAANTAILDMADNSAKLGTPIESIQVAYQGFAKGQYQLLDNLKLGYGGTKTEMQRLLKDAEKISGVKYDMSNLGDVYDAIHVVQEELGLTGVAAAEAEGTFTGSLGSMKAAAENLMANLALGEDITDELNVLMTSASTFITKNLGPMVANILTALPNLLTGLSTIITDSISNIDMNSLVQTGLQIVTGLANAIVTAVPQLLIAAGQLVIALGQALLETDWLSYGASIILNLKDSLMTAAADMFGGDPFIVSNIGQGITAALPEILGKGVEILTNLVNGILENIPQLIATAGELVTSFATFILENLPAILDAGAQLFTNLVNGIVKNLPKIASTALDVVVKFAAAIAKNLPQILQKGIELLGRLLAGIIQAIPKIPGTIMKVINAIKEKFSGFDWKEIGKNILEGVKNGILNATKMVVDAAKEAAGKIWDGIKGFFKIESPSKLTAYAGEMIDAGLAKGILDNEGMVDKAVKSLSTTASTSLQVNPTYGSFTGPQTDLDALTDLLARYLPVIASGENTKVVIEADAGRMFRVMQRESIRNTQLVGTNAVLAAH
ncbi:MAG: hypothetical protein J6U56_05255 [Spirochaetia bacterium]|nr:hypothetical protein [Spirochaetia bacterium]